MARRMRIVFPILAVLLVSLACSFGQVTPTATLTAIPTSTESPPSTPTLEVPAFPQYPPVAVVLVPEGETLSVHTAAGEDSPVKYTLPPQAADIQRTGFTQTVDDVLWVEIADPAQGTGWVDAHYLTEYWTSDQFCADQRIDQLLDDFVTAIQTQDGATLAQIVSPTHGLTLRHNWWNPEVHYSPSVIANLFSDATAYDWGVQDGSGYPIQGSFAEVALLQLLDVFNADYTRYCNDLENGSGGSAGYVIWPFEYGNLNYVALYRAALTGDELNWRTWAVGIEYVFNDPYIAFLVNYQWEI